MSDYLDGYTLGSARSERPSPLIDTWYPADQVRARDREIAEWDRKHTKVASPDATEGHAVPQLSLAERLLSRRQLAQLPTPAPLIHGTIDKATVVLLAGWYGTLKSFVGIDWGASIATGHSWHGRSVHRQRVLYVAGEGTYGLHQRVTAWERHRGITVDDQAFVTLPLAPNLGKPSQVNELCAVVAGEGFGVVLVDTIAKSAVGLDENSAQDMGRVVDALYRIRAATDDGTVVGIHHTGKDKTTIRGSSALEAGVDTVYLTEGDPASMRLSRTKRKDGPTEDVLMLSLEAITGTDSAVLVSAAMADLSRRAADLLAVFSEGFSATGATKADLRAAAEMPPATFARALNTLVDTGLVVNTGTSSRPFYVMPEVS